MNDMHRESLRPGGASWRAGLEATRAAHRPVAELRQRASAVDAERVERSAAIAELQRRLPRERRTLLWAGPAARAS